MRYKANEKISDIKEWKKLVIYKNGYGFFPMYLNNFFSHGKSVIFFNFYQNILLKIAVTDVRSIKKNSIKKKVKWSFSNESF
jgi:hypothetical protein